MNDLSGCFSLDERRQAADAFVADALKQLPEFSCPSDETLLTALRLWGFDKNTGRPNVQPDGQDWVHSDTVGLIESWNDHKIYISKASRMNFLGLLARFIRCRMPLSLRTAQLPFTTISVNKGYGAKLHRDRNNVGPSVGFAVGSWKGGVGLRYWPNDGKTGSSSSIISSSSSSSRSSSSSSGNSPAAPLAPLAVIDLL